MLTKKYRLPLQNYYKNPGQAVKNSFFSVKVIQSALPFSRFGVVVGSKIDKRASRRNFIRRVIFNWVKFAELHKKPGKDVIITVFFPARSLNKMDIECELAKAFWLIVK